MVMLMKFFKDETGLELSEYAVVGGPKGGGTGGGGKHKKMGKGARTEKQAATVAAFTLLNERIAARIETLAGFIQ